ncbi:MAG: NAD-dependent epimerase, partial [Caldilinea sp.]|nr:NAD-dependent epimerase [Caldilinea sp.]MDW8442016.1 NAD-dependent epimerase [Caldilineaceae bacterium]
FDAVSQLTGLPMRYRYVDQPRKGDHICYISDLSHMRRQLPGWDITRSLSNIFDELVAGWQERLKQ